MTDRWRVAGLPLIAAVLLVAGAVKLWSTGSGLVAGGALFGAGLLLLGVAVRDWLDRPRPDHPHDDWQEHP